MWCVAIIHDEQLRWPRSPQTTFKIISNLVKPSIEMIVFVTLLPLGNASLSLSDIITPLSLLVHEVRAEDTSLHASGV